MKVLVVVDMQNDFVDGAIGTKEAEAIVDDVVKKVKSFDGEIIFTQDTHGEDYMETQEGKKLPVKHTQKGTHGWEIVEPLNKLVKENNYKIVEKPNFGSPELAEGLYQLNEKEPIESIELIGICTDICVVSNAILIKAKLPEIPIIVDAKCCAGVTPEKHEAALDTLESCQVEVVNR